MILRPATCYSNIYVEDFLILSCFHASPGDEAIVLAVVIDVQDIFSSSPNHVLLHEQMVNRLGEVRLDLHELLTSSSARWRPLRKGYPTSQ